MTQAPPTDATELRRDYQLYIGGVWTDAYDGRTAERMSPATGDVVSTFPSAGEQDLERAVAAARRAFDRSPWPSSPSKERSRVLFRAAELLRERKEDIGRRIALELGKPLRLSIGEVTFTAEVLEYYGALAQDLRGELISQHTADALGLILKEPVGVVGMITPWNFPLLLLSWKVAPAIAAGCTMVAKPASFTPGAAFEFARVLSDAGVPDGVFNVVTGSGAVVGGALTAHQDVDKVAFTGSTEVGQQVLTSAARNMKKVTLELGGKSPNIVFGDADLKAAAQGAYWGAFLNSGQACQAGTRLLVEQSIHDEFVSTLKDLAANSRIGDPLDMSTLIGPVVDEGQLNTVLDYIERGSSEGAELVCGGSRMTGDQFAGGFFVAPTVFDNVTNSMSIGREEIFGPVLSVFTFEDFDEAMAIANDTMYGLSAAVWSRDIDKSIRAAKTIRAGTVWVNAYHDAGMPFVMPMGGYKASGMGRELGREGLQEYFETKGVHVRLGQA
jgi:acyl-CoA reductase-like NAD-dependent aldehyde dehydrogenase